MVERINHSLRRYQKNLGFLKISVDELLNLLSEERVFNKVSFQAETADHNFSSLQDMKENKELLVGRCKIIGKFSKFNRFTIDFSDSVEVYAHELSSEEELTKLKSLATNLAKHTKKITILKRTFDSKFFFLLMILSSVFLSLFGAFAHRNMFVDVLAVSAFIYVIAFAFFLAAVVVLDKVWKPIVIEKKDSFWDRNKDDFYKYIITLIIGMSIPWLITLVTKS